MFWSKLCKSSWNCAWNLCVSCIYLTYCMEHVWKSSLWIGIFQRATQRARILLTDNIQNGGSCSVNYYKLYCAWLVWMKGQVVNWKYFLTQKGWFKSRCGATALELVYGAYISCLVRLCVLVCVLFSIFSIFYITLFGSCPRLSGLYGRRSTNGFQLGGIGRTMLFMANGK